MSIVQEWLKKEDILGQSQVLAQSLLDKLQNVILGLPNIIPKKFQLLNNSLPNPRLFGFRRRQTSRKIQRNIFRRLWSLIILVLYCRLNVRNKRFHTLNYFLFVIRSLFTVLSILLFLKLYFKLRRLFWFRC